MRRPHYLAHWLPALCLAPVFVASVMAACTHLDPGSASAGPGGPGAGSDGGVIGMKPGSNPYDAGMVGMVIPEGGGLPDVAQMACGDTKFTDPWSPGYEEDPSALTNATATVQAMQVSDMADQMRGTAPGSAGSLNWGDIFRTLDWPQTGTASVKGFQFRDGPRGLCLATQIGVVNGVTLLNYSTAFPVPIARGAAFDMDLEYQVAEAIGDEVLASGNTMVLAPVINILRHPAWGRAQETYGEDSYLLGRLGTAFVTGAQNYIPACVKHYAAYNIEDGRAALNAQMDEQTLQERYIRHFGAVIQDSGVACVMASYNLVNGEKATTSSHLLTDILRTEFGFRGFVLSDWWALPNGSNFPTQAAILQQTAVAGLSAQMDMELPWNFNYAELESAQSAGQLTTSQIQTSATRILEQKFRFNVANPNGTIGLKQPTTTYDATNRTIGNNAAHITLSHRAALESMVLMKNASNTLPIPSSAHTVAVIGAQVPWSAPGTAPPNGTVDFAADARLGDLGSSRVFTDPATTTGPFGGLQKAAPSGVTITSGHSASDVGNADFVVVVAGLTPEDEGEEYTKAGDRQSFALDAKDHGSILQNDLITQVAALGKPMVVVLEGGSVIDMPWINQVPAVVMAWYPGQDGGTALGELLFGKSNFSGKLPVTWAAWSDEPEFNAGPTTPMGFFLGYGYFDAANKKPIFPFGYGLSYTTFSYNKDLVIPCSSVSAGGVVNVQFEVTNSGTVAGDETAFLFVSYPNTKVQRQPKDLKGFIRVTLDPGVTKLVTIPLRVSDLSYWDTTSNSWVVESGPVSIMVGGSSDSLPATGTLNVK